MLHVSVTSTQAILLLVNKKAKQFLQLLPFTLVTLVNVLVGKTCREKIILNVYNEKGSSFVTKKH